MAHLNVRIRVTEDHTDEVLARLQQAIGAGIGKAASGIAQLAARRAPRQRSGTGGELAESIGAIQVGPVTWVIQAQAPHAHIVEQGARQVPARPFLVPALLDYRGQIALRIHEAWKALGGG